MLSTIGGVGMWSVVVALPAVQQEFGVARAGASFPYTLTMLGFGVAGMAFGRWSDRAGIRIPLMGGHPRARRGLLRVRLHDDAYGSSRSRRDF